MDVRQGPSCDVCNQGFLTLSVTSCQGCGQAEIPFDSLGSFAGLERQNRSAFQKRLTFAVHMGYLLDMLSRPRMHLGLKLWGTLEAIGQLF
jgi:hypothetical protein